jgi:hypothetical protein
MHAWLQSIERFCDCTRRYDFSAECVLGRPRTFVFFNVSGREGGSCRLLYQGKKNADVAFKYEEKYTCNYFALFYPEVGTLMSSEHKVIPASFFLE